jgi:general secretion pathway protein M
MSNFVSTFLEQRTMRERQLLGMTAGLLALALVWWVFLAPALQTYRQSDSAHAKLDAEFLQMQSMAEESANLKAVPRVTPEQTKAWLEGAIKKLGKASFTQQEGRVQVSFVGATPEALAAYLADARTRAQLVPSEAHWKKSADKSAEKSAEVLWDGSLVFEVTR